MVEQEDLVTSALGLQLWAGFFFPDSPVICQRMDSQFNLLLCRVLSRDLPQLATGSLVDMTRSLFYTFPPKTALQRNLLLEWRQGLRTEGGLGGGACSDHG